MTLISRAALASRITVPSALVFGAIFTVVVVGPRPDRLASFATGQAAAADVVDFVRDVRPILEKHCYACHGPDKQKSGLRLDVRAAALQGGDGEGPAVVARKSAESPIVRRVSSEDRDERMPPEGPGLSKQEIATLVRWIDGGATWPDGVDRATLVDKRDHWSFKPLSAPAGRESLDQFIVAKLQERNLALSPAAAPTDWLRRVTFDLTGLPPSPDEVRAFIDAIAAEPADTRPERSYADVVERLLKSPRYGERWAQHWLDVVRYADTHGFEVNTERPNAWPYRDYVIRAFNRDTPYDQFIREQIVGDALGEDAATGFLITASVLLPGQIGKDAASIRLARQDSLDEIVNNIGQTFLGLSVGCARCHDHKFDPITARDYYAMQAFVAGVEYADREIRSPEAEARKLAAEPLRRRVREINDRLAGFVPLARPGSSRRTTDPKQNTETFEPLVAKFVRFTIHDANLHPSLGLIEPCIDEFEIFSLADSDSDFDANANADSDEPTPRNVALASNGTKVTASGSNESALHKLEHVNDGQYGNARSWMSNTRGRGWVQFELPEPTKISKVVWGRDRQGQFTDRLATAFTLEASVEPNRWVKLAEVVAPRPTVGASAVNIDRFTPVRTKSVRFTVLATNSLEPCLDELEFFNSAGENVALASRGTRATTSGNIISAGRHEPDFVNDGRYGNERSWLGNEAGKGWVRLDFTDEQEIVRAAWSRDRESKHEDRLPIEYRIEVLAGDEWRVVADSTDRRPHVAGMSRGPEFTLSGLTPDEAAAAQKLLSERVDLEAKIKAAEQGQLAFAGTFRQPDEIRLLARGDPEQPKEEVAPAVLKALGELTLDKATPEQQRRRALADWIASPANPLTVRVIVNRVWQGHFGSGLVSTPSDFGRSGLRPTHPELLDWLARRFIDGGWSIKRLHREIVLSRTYRQTSAPTPDERVARAVQQDADVLLLWRYPSRRLEAESIRDAMLAVSGRLNLTMYGRGFDLFDKRGGLSGFTPVELLSAENQRRMIYAHKVRRESEAVFGAFDCPDAGQSAAVRRASTTPIQALNLFNSRFTLDLSTAFADRVASEVKGGEQARAEGNDSRQGERQVTRKDANQLEQQIERAYELALNRRPQADELREATAVVREHGLAVLCRVLFNCNEFLFMP